MNNLERIRIDQIHYIYRLILIYGYTVSRIEEFEPNKYWVHLIETLGGVEFTKKIAIVPQDEYFLNLSIKAL